MTKHVASSTKKRLAAASLALGLGGFGLFGVMSAALLSTPVASSDPPPYVVGGQPYGQAQAILNDLGIDVVKTVKHGNDLPLAQCIVTSQSVDGDGDLNGTGMILWLNCEE